MNHCAVSLHSSRCCFGARSPSRKRGANGTLQDPALAVPLAPGMYEAVFHVADYYRESNAALPAIPFLDVVRYASWIAYSGQHLPMKLTP